MAFLSSLLLAISASQSIVYGASLALTPPETAPGSKPIDRSFIGFGIKATDFNGFAGTKSSPNVLSRNLIENIAERSGSAMNVRVGGTVFDHMLYKADQQEPVKQIAKQDPLGGIEYTVGPSYFESFSAIPNIRYTWQVPLSTGSIENTVQLAKLGVDAIGSDNLDAIEIGNEPSAKMFAKDGESDSAAADTYVQKWVRYASAVSANISSLPSGPIYQGLGLRSESVPPFDIPTLFEKGINKLKNLKSVSHHFYEVFPGRDGIPFKNSAQYLEATLLDHNFTVQSTNQFKSAVTFLARNNADVSLVLGEIGNALPGAAEGMTREDQQQVESSLATGLWTADFLLHCMSIGVQGISNQLGNGWLFSPWVAQPSEPEVPSVRPTYYGIVLAADFFGSNSSQPTRVQSLEISGSAASITAYASYHGPELSSIAICNLDLWDASVSNGPRPDTQIKLQLPTGVRNVIVQRLTGPGAFAQDQVTWGGQSWTYENKGTGVVVSKDTQTLPVQQGHVTVSVKAMEAVVVSLQR